MNKQEWRNEREDTEAKWDVGAEMRRLFDAESEDLPPLFFETLLLSEGIEEEVAWYEGLEERSLRRFFRKAGLDYDAWRRKRRRRRRTALVLVSLLALILAAGAGVTVWPQALEAIRQPLLQWFTAPPTPTVERNVTHHASVSDIQPHFSVRLPQEPPTGFRLVDVTLELGFPAGPRGTIFYQRGDPSDPIDRGVELHLLIWPLMDEPFPFPAEATAEEIDLAGLTAYWIEGTGGGRQEPTWRRKGEWLVWELEGWKFALVSMMLSREECVPIGEELVRQQ